MASRSNDSDPEARRDPFALLNPDEEAAGLTARLDEWGRYYGTEGGYTAWVMSRVVVASVQLDRDRAQESALRGYEAERARTSWDEDRRLDVEDLGARLKRDPARVRRRLEDSLQGADWLMERWEALERIAETGRAWSAAQRALALDLLGTPATLRNGPTTLDPTPDRDDQPDADPAPAQAALAGSERARLVRLRERVLRHRDESERGLAESGLSLSFSPAMVRLHRHEALWLREYHRAMNEFMRTRRRPSEPTTATTTPALPPPPPAEPVPASEPTPMASSYAELAALDRILLSRVVAGRQQNLAIEAATIGAGDVEEQDREGSARSARVMSSCEAPIGNRRARRARLARTRSKG